MVVRGTHRSSSWLPHVIVVMMVVVYHVRNVNIRRRHSLCSDEAVIMTAISHNYLEHSYVIYDKILLPNVRKKSITIFNQQIF